MINYQLLYDSLPQLAAGAWITVKIALLSFLMGFIVGTILGFLQTTHMRLVSWAIAGYVTLIRGTPMLVQLTFMYYLLPMIGITLSNFWVAVIALAVNSSAYISQIIRSGIHAVGQEQVEAAYVLGFGKLKIARYIVFPQAIRVILPALSGEIITLVKDSSLASAIGVMELYKEARSIMNQTYDVVTIFFAVALFYLAVTSLIAFFVGYLQRRMNCYAYDRKSH